jgi:hypothetical protein
MTKLPHNFFFNSKKLFDKSYYDVETTKLQ